MAKPLVRLLLPLAAAGLLVFGVGALGRLAREALRRDDRYTLPFASIECSPPPGMDREKFLSEVQFLAGMPDRLALLDDEAAAQLRVAFRRHPWVETVEEVKLTRERVLVRLRYRKPVLAVMWNGRKRVVDRQGVLLPDSATTEGLPVFSDARKGPAGPAGSPWDDPAVEQAARMAGK